MALFIFISSKPNVGWLPYEENQEKEKEREGVRMYAHPLFIFFSKSFSSHFLNVTQSKQSEIIVHKILWDLLEKHTWRKNYYNCFLCFFNQVSPQRLVFRPIHPRGVALNLSFVTCTRRMRMYENTCLFVSWISLGL